jgi:hypothetical protein
VFEFRIMSNVKYRNLIDIASQSYRQKIYVWRGRLMQGYKDKMSINHWRNDTDRGNQIIWKKFCPSVNAFAPNRTWTDPTRTSAARGQQRTAWTMALFSIILKLIPNNSDNGTLHLHILDMWTLYIVSDTARKTALWKLIYSCLHVKGRRNTY